MGFYKWYATSYQLEIKLYKECDSLKVNATLSMKPIGSLSNLTFSEINIFFFVNVVSNFMQYHKEIQLKTTKRIVLY